MNGRLVWAVAVLTTLAGAVALGTFLQITDQAHWQQRLDDACAAITSNQTAIQSAAATGQDLFRLQQQLNTAASQYYAAARHLHLKYSDASTECETP
jgi:hypothetical protein